MVGKKRSGICLFVFSPRHSPCIMFMTSTLLRLMKSHVTSVCSCLQQFQESTESSLLGRRKKGGSGGGEKREKKKRRSTQATQRDKKSTSESTIPEKTTYRIDYMGKVTSCFGSSKFLMTFRFVAQPKNFHLTATYVYIDFISRLLPTYPECQRLFMLRFWFRSSLSKDSRDKLRRTAFSRRFVRHQSITP